MSRHITRFSILVSLLSTTAACTQAPAMVDLKGQNTYGRSGVSNYAANGSYNGLTPSAGGYQTQSVDSTPQSSASIQSIGVSDLPSPASSASKPVAAKPQAAAPVNPWTHSVRSSDTGSHDDSLNIRPQGNQHGKEQMVSEVKLKQNKSVAALDSIIGNDGSDTKKPATSASKPVKVAASGFMWPVNSKKVISQFGPKGGGKINDGINIASADGEPVWAAADGEVVYVGNELQGYGNMVLIKHNGNKATTYAHLGSATVEKYDRVKQGDIIGYVGTSGNVKEPQLHFAIRDGKDPVDPVKYLSRNVASAE